METDPISRQELTTAPQHSAQTTQPASTGVDFGKVLTAGVGIAASVAGKSLGASSIGGLIGGGGASLGNVNNDLDRQQVQFAEMIQIQNRMQVQNMEVTMVSNVSKTEHETRMAAVRNIKQ